MTLNQFTAYDPDVQVDIIRAEGTLIGNREDSYSLVELYQLHNFYAELYFRREDDELWKAGGFDHPVLLKPYLDQIDISSLQLDE